MPSSTEPFGDKSSYSEAGMDSCDKMRFFFAKKEGGGVIVWDDEAGGVGRLWMRFLLFNVNAMKVFL